MEGEAYPRTDARRSIQSGAFPPFARHRLLNAPLRTSSPVNRHVDAVFVLSVRTFHDRIRHIEAELGRHGIQEFVNAKMVQLA